MEFRLEWDWPWTPEVVCAVWSHWLKCPEPPCLPHNHPHLVPEYLYDWNGSISKSLNESPSNTKTLNLQHILLKFDFPKREMEPAEHRTDWIVTISYKDEWFRYADLWEMEWNICSHTISWSSSAPMSYQALLQIIRHNNHLSVTKLIVGIVMCCGKWRSDDSHTRTLT